VLTIAGKIYSLGNLPFFSVLPVIGAKQQTPFTLNILRQLQSLKVPVLNSAEAIENSDDKLKCYQYLKKQGFENLPVTFDLSQELKPDELAQLPEDVVVKQAQGSSGGDAVWFVKKQELQNYIGPNRLVQERIALETETDSATGQALVVDYRYFVINGKTRMVAKNISAPGEFATNIKKGGTRERVKIDRKMAIIAEDVVNRIGLNWAGVDIGRSIDGKIYVLEVNPTPSMLYGSFPAFHGPRKRLYREILQTVVVLAKGRQKEIKKNLTAIA
jgi:glutathione synthase/RimK-type ligase-like ATP-grasp enzyme